MTLRTRSWQQSCKLLGAAFIGTLVVQLSVWGGEGPGQLSQDKVPIKIVTLDALSGKPTPARIELLDANGKSYIADNALSMAGDREDRDIIWLGSPEEAKVWFGAAPRRSIGHAWARGPQFYSDGEADVLLSPGKYTVSAFKGIEFLDAEKEFQIEAGSKETLTLELRRWVHMADEGWYSADDHLHIPRFVPELDAMILKCMKAEDLNIANLLRWGHARHFHNTPQHTSGFPGVYREGNYLLLSGQENPRTHFLGHTIILGASPPIHQDDRYLIYRLFFEQAHRQGAANGFAHKGQLFEARNGLGINLPDGFVHFIEVLQFMGADYNAWYDALNTGFRLTPTAGTDYPFGRPFPGRERFYTRVTGKFSAQSWLDTVKEGRTFVTMGPIVELTVDSKLPGDELTLQEPGSVVVAGRVRINPQRDRLDKVELVWCGEVITTFSPKRGESEFRFEVKRDIREAGWLALRTSGAKLGFQGNPRSRRAGIPRSHSHTAAVYLLIEGQPNLKQHPRAKKTAQKWIDRLQNLEDILRDEDQTLEKLAGGNPLTGVPVAVMRQNREDLLQVVQEALKHFREQ